ncbi:hypothetical protein EVC45_14370 [Paraburkholderia sp. UYCP14C]|nr:hypothetical protein EVC45_14370 [Paraburkholderia sp. UYCP14C]
MKAVRNHNDVVKELTHIGTLLQCLEQSVQRDCVDWLGTVFATPTFWRARIEANAELPPVAPRPDVIIAHRHD